ncbi:hemolysin type calcium-binding protein [Phyllobacterium bourgognense]|uniref:Hemolysin type calcium-binding protein n=2 Tax=Phyllobacterium bourgognense TaxID=314236 RepID=A0A368YU74_9HYPH|nr:hemolysin type calcium-binding protein [Phyllobacterium bourgognense]
MASILPQSIFDLLKVWNGGWLPPVSGDSRNNTLDGTDTMNNPANDDLRGLGGNDTLNGLAGNDRLEGGDGSDTLNGGAGSDQLYGGTNVLLPLEVLNGGDGNDYIEGGAGADTINGGNGNDTASYESSQQGVTVALAIAGVGVALGGDAALDVLIGIENLVGSDQVDSLTGDGGNNILIGLDGKDTLNGGDGNDTLIGGAGADILNGGAGNDTVDYSTSASVDGVTVDLLDSNFIGGDAQGDTLNNIQSITGSDFDDTIRGDSGNNVLRGGLGADYISAEGPTILNPAGNDVLIGGWGSDELFCRDGPSSVDRIVYENYFDSRLGDFDRISVDAEDILDLRLIDANDIEVGDQAFVKVSVSSPNSLHIGQLAVIHGDIYLETGVVDMRIHLVGGVEPQFIL